MLKSILETVLSRAQRKAVSAFGQAPQVLGDILGLVRMGLRPANRCSVAATADTGQLTLWNVRNDGCELDSLRTADDLVRVYGGDAPNQAQARLDKSGGDEEAFWRDVMALVDTQLSVQ